MMKDNMAADVAREVASCKASVYLDDSGQLNDAYDGHLGAKVPGAVSQSAAVPGGSPGK